MILGLNFSGQGYENEDEDGEDKEGRRNGRIFILKFEFFEFSFFGFGPSTNFVFWLWSLYCHIIFR